jgi:hypothetical protein
MADLNGANLTSANLTGARLLSANLNGADLSAADVTNADLNGARWSPDTPVPEGWQLDTSSGRSDKDDIGYGPERARPEGLESQPSDP